ncbi:hypothetical protein RJ640_029085 [Escallonia rubra]|uniref:Cation/H(+) antiporter 15 n=1 Tax=Escallonia rubra TaxID=112253 RepID=A0AA88RQS0_9ASTE|nr:hypothetical protein RJ640_029085 [Escallonia rubra]
MSNTSAAYVANNETIVCYAPQMVTSKGVWLGDNPFKLSLPVFILQLLLIVATSRLLHFFLKPFRQPRVVSEVLGGFILGPSVLGRSKFGEIVFPLRSVMVLDTMANVGLLYFLFLIGVETDISIVQHVGRKALVVALAGMLFPFIISVSSSFIIHKELTTIERSSYILFFVVALSVTAFPVLVRILAELKLLKMKIGRLAMSAALISDLCGWFINLLEASHPTKNSPLCIYVLHLIELTDRASAMLIVRGTQESGRPAVSPMQAQSNHVIKSFKNFMQHNSCVSVHPLTAISYYSTMHQDICNMAEDKRVTFIVIPFHKQQMVDGEMASMNPEFRILNQNVLANAPCSVGILVDRGLSGSTDLAANQLSHHIAVLFFGGPDDREALSYASRMAEHPGNSLCVVRFLPGKNSAKLKSEPSLAPTNPKTLKEQTDSRREKLLDNDLIKDFRIKAKNDESLVYIERLVNNGEETVEAVRSVDDIHDLFIVGRGQGIFSHLTAGLTDWSECPELGTIGDLLASSDFSAKVSVLVVQQYTASGVQEEETGIPDSPSQQDKQYITNQVNQDHRPQ